MTTQEMSNEVRGIYVETLALESVEERGEVTGNVGEADSVEGCGTRERLTGQIRVVGVDGGIVVVLGAYRLAAAFVVAEEVAVAAADQQFGGRSPVPTEGINRQRVHGAIVGAESARIGRSTGIYLPIGAVRAAELTVRKSVV